MPLNSRGQRVKSYKSSERAKALRGFTRTKKKSATGGKGAAVGGGT